jgi:hypothetical protein
MKIIEKEFNVLTGEETITERDETATEKANRLAKAKLVAEQAAEAQAKAAQRQALLTRLGLTEEEARILLGGN